MVELADKDNSPLKDSEISRLIEVSKSAGYKKQDSIPARNLIDFKPKSLLEIAFKEDSINEKEEKNIETPANVTPKKDDLIEEAQKTENEDSVDQGLELEDSEEPKPSENETPNNENTSKNISQDLTSNIDEENQSKESIPVDKVENQPETNQSLETNGTEGAKNEVDPLIAAKQEGIEIGKNMAIKAAENNLVEATKTLHRVIDSLKDKDFLDKTNLVNSILTTITNIASERAGQVIDDHPKSFTEKIVAFINDIDRSSKKVILNLNPHDAKLIGSTILEQFSDDELQIKENSDLFRGDSILQTGSIEIGDIISERITYESEIDNNSKDIGPEVVSETAIASDKEYANDKKV